MITLVHNGETNYREDRHEHSGYGLSVADLWDGYNILRIRVVMSSNRHEYLIRRHLIWQSFASSCMNNKAH